ncbi:MAG: hypothetical protein RL757_758 [Bacteroidota bacterium]|jgi:hypothetical protein
MLKKIFVVVFFAVSCGTSKQVSIAKTATPLSADATVELIGESQTPPNTAQFLGSVKIGDSGASVGCDYATVISQAQKQARAMGGNLMHLKKHSYPSIVSTCHRIECDVYLVK